MAGGVSALAVGLLMLASAGWSVSVGATHLPTLLAEDGVGPVTDGEWVVWASSPYDDPSPELLATRLFSHETVSVTGGPVPLRGYDLERSAVVWSATEPGCQEPCDRNIYARVLPSDHVYEVATSADDETYPVISGTLVVWHASDGERWQIQARDLGEMSEPFTIYTADAAAESTMMMYPVVSRPFVAWATVWQDDDLEASLGYRLWIQNLDTDGPPQVVAEGLGLLSDFDLAGSTLVYAVDGTGIVAVDLVAGSTTTVAAMTRDVAIDGRYIVWTAPKGGGTDASDGADLRAHDLSTGASFTVATGNRFALSPHLANGWLTWEHGGLPFPDDEYPHDIHAAPLSDLLPSGRRPDAEVTIPEVVYYPETGHYLGWQFRTYWEANGGLPVFGYPMTEEYEERSRDTGQTHTVQFFERQRFERHPENAGTPYEVLLGRLGYEDALARGLLETTPFQPILHDIVRGDCVWFGETRQMACADFMAYWRSQGLDLGDVGISFRESLALFGYPISQPYVDTETGLLTQYFERAVFELHPDNPDPYRVLLRRLGADVLDARGW